MVAPIGNEVKQCGIRGCYSPSAWQPVLLFYAAESHGEHEPARGEAGIGVCDACKTALKVEHLVTEEGWMKICKSFLAAGKAVPEIERTELTFERLEEKKL